MPSIQSQIQYNIRKRLPPIELNEKKENEENSSSSSRSRLSLRNKISPINSHKSNSKEEDKSPRRQLQHEVYRTPRCTKRLFQGNPDDEDDKQIPSPPKQERKVSTPSTPSELLSRLKLNQRTPTVLTETPLSPTKKLFTDHEDDDDDDDEDNVSPKPGSISQNVRQSLHSSVPAQMPGREVQLSQLHRFLKKHLNAKSSGTLYVSGPPGTGKTACLSKIMLLPEFKNGFKTVYVNCTTMKSAISIYGRISQELGIRIHGKAAKDYLASINAYFAKNKKIILLVLDEIDQLDCKDQSVLYTIFEWPSKIDAKLVLVGIANALDLTDRILPRLQARLELKPTLMHFSPYSKEQIIGILSGRLEESDMSHMFTPMAVQLVAAKVASVSGDARRALDIARRVVEMADSRVMPLQPTTDHKTNTRSPKKIDNASVKLDEVLTVLNTVYGAAQTLEEDCDDGFPLQQKLILCTLVLIVSKGSFKDITVSKVNDVYRKMCLKQNLKPVSMAEFHSLCGLIEMRGIISVHARKEPKLNKICLQWDAEEVSAVLKDKQLLAEIMNDSSCLAK